MTIKPIRRFTAYILMPGASMNSIEKVVHESDFDPIVDLLRRAHRYVGQSCSVRARDLSVEICEALSRCGCEMERPDLAEMALDRMEREAEPATAHSCQK